MEVFLRKRRFGSSPLVFVPVAVGIGFEFCQDLAQIYVDIVVLVPGLVVQFIGIIIGQDLFCGVITETVAVHEHPVGAVVNVVFLVVFDLDGIRKLVIGSFGIGIARQSTVRVSALVVIPGRESFQIKHVDKLLDL